MSGTLSTQFSRVMAITVDELGIDPLLDKVVPLIHSIVEHSTYTVTAKTQAAPDLIALDTYGSSDLWWVVLEYNGIGHYKNLTSGTIIKLPDPSALVSAFVAAGIKRDNVVRTITI